MIFLLTKSGSPSFWTHRDLPGQRTAPTPDYRWRDALTGIEYTDEPDAYTEGMIPCPDCGGEGEITVQAGQVSLFDGVPSLVMECDKCKGEGEIKRWKRTNLWQSHDYFYDAEAVREPHTQGTIDRFGKNPARSPQVKYGTEGIERNNASFRASMHTGLIGSANVRNVWQIPTQGRPDAHFATFPDELPRRCILAGTSEHGVCGECGAPWVRLVEKSVTHESGSGKAGNPPEGKSRQGPRRQKVVATIFAWGRWFTPKLSAGNPPAAAMRLQFRPRSWTPSLAQEPAAPWARALAAVAWA